MNFVRNKKRWKIGLAAVAIIVAGSLVYRAIAVRVEKNHFLAAQADLEKLFVTIQNTVGKPDQIKREASCDRPNLKYEKGPLGCDVSIDALYENKNAGESTMLMNKLIKLNTGSVRIGSASTTGTSFMPKDSVRGDQIFYQSLSSQANFSCTIGYRYPFKAYLEDIFHPISQENIEISLSCGGPARTQYFPFKN